MLKHVLSQKLLATVLVACAAAFLTVSLNDSVSRGQEKKEEKKQEKRQQPQPLHLRYYATTVDAIQAMAPENSKDRMTDGLNTLAASGWALFAIDAGNGNQSGYYVFQRAR